MIREEVQHCTVHEQTAVKDVYSEMGRSIELAEAGMLVVNSADG